MLSLPEQLSGDSSITKLIVFLAIKIQTLFRKVKGVIFSYLSHEPLQSLRYHTVKSISLALYLCLYPDQGKKANNFLRYFAGVGVNMVR